MSFGSKSDMTFEKMSAKDLKSVEQIRRHSIDSRLEGKTVERALHIFTVGDEVQKLSVVGSLPELMQEDRGAVLQSLVPKVLQGLTGASTEYHVTMTTSVQTIIKEKILASQSFIDSFLPAVLQHMDHKDQVVANAWCDTLVDAIQALPTEYVKQHITNIVVQRSHMIRPASVRASTCTIVAEMALRYDMNLLKKDLLPMIMTLAQDMDIDVRTAMASNLFKVVRALKLETFRTTIGNALLELAGDETTKVKEATFKSIANILDVIGLDNVKTHMLPVIKQLIHFGFKNDDSLLIAISDNYGKICTGIDKVTTEKEMFVKYFITMAGMGAAPSRRKTTFPEPAFHIVHTALNPEKYVLCRQACAQNFPAMCKFVEGNQNLTEMLHQTLNELNTDSYYVVRRIVGQGIADTCQSLGKSAHLLKNNVLQLLLDEAEEVLDGFFPNLAAIIEGLIRIGVYKPDPPPKDTSVSDLNKAILRCENIISPSHNWRLYSTFLAQIEGIYKFNASDIQFNNYIALFLKRMHGTRTVPVRVALMRTVLVFLRYLQKPSQRSEVRNRIINEFCQSTSFYNRVFYLRTCYLIFDIFSTYYFKEYFFFRTLQLMDDPVANVRWALLMMLPKLRQMSKHPSEKKMQALVDTALSKLADDKDKEISRVFESVKNSLDVPDQKLFANDAKKYEEERKLLGESGGGGGGGGGGVGGGGGGALQTGGMQAPMGGGLRKPPGAGGPGDSARQSIGPSPSTGSTNRNMPPRGPSAPANPGGQRGSSAGQVGPRPSTSR